MNLTEDEHNLYIKILSGMEQKRNNEDTSEFSVPDFFSENEWFEVPNSSRLKLGKLFKQKVDDNLMLNVVFCYMSKKKWAIYKMVF
jgi:hypothetical protein